jgi:hypothetical protein
MGSARCDIIRRDIIELPEAEIVEVLREFGFGQVVAWLPAGPRKTNRPSVPAPAMEFLDACCSTLRAIDGTQPCQRQPEIAKPRAVRYPDMKGSVARTVQ